MWVRQCDLDATTDVRSPVPTRIASNEEFVPPPQLPEQKAVEERLRDLSDRNARSLGIDRRQFLRTKAGMAAALLAMNEVFGDFFDVSAAEAKEPEAFGSERPVVGDRPPAVPPDQGGDGRGAARNERGVRGLLRRLGGRGQGAGGVRIGTPGRWGSTAGSSSGPRRGWPRRCSQ